MKITRQLRLDALAADGAAPIHLTIMQESTPLGTSLAGQCRP
ncbi:MAG: hypothetical protein ACRYF0_07380 [Janthinobacterium lividum]